jgi:hypothetical protein
MHTRKQGLKFLYAGFGKIKGNPVAVTRIVTASCAQTPICSSNDAAFTSAESTW